MGRLQLKSTKWGDFSNQPRVISEKCKLEFPMELITKQIPRLYLVSLIVIMDEAQELVIYNNLPGN